MKNKFETNIEKRDDTIFSIIPVEHLVMNSIDRLGDYLLVYVPFILFEDYQTAVELNDDEKELIQKSINKFGEDKLKDIKKSLPDYIKYESIRAVIIEKYIS